MEIGRAFTHIGMNWQIWMKDLETKMVEPQMSERKTRSTDRARDARKEWNPTEEKGRPEDPTGEDGDARKRLKTPLRQSQGKENWRPHYHDLKLQCWSYRMQGKDKICQEHQERPRTPRSHPPQEDVRQIWTNGRATEVREENLRSFGSELREKYGNSTEKDW